MQRIRPGQVVASRRVTVTRSGKIKARKNPKKDAIEKSVDKTPFGPLIGALDFGKTSRPRKAAKARRRNGDFHATWRGHSRSFDTASQAKRWIAMCRKIAREYGDDAAEQYAYGKSLAEIKRERTDHRPTQRNAKMSRFDRCVKSVTERGGSYDARAVCASAGRRKYGKRKFQAMAKAGKARAARKRARQR